MAIQDYQDDDFVINNSNVQPKPQQPAAPEAAEVTKVTFATPEPKVTESMPADSEVETFGEVEFMPDKVELEEPSADTEEQVAEVTEVVDKEEPAQVDIAEETDSDKDGPEAAVETELTPEETLTETSAFEDKLASMIEARMAAVTACLVAIETKFDEKISNDEHKNELFNKMYAELSDYKRDLYSKLLKPFITEAIRLLEDYERFIDRMQGATMEQIGRFIQDLPDDINNMLENNGVERYSDDTEKFNPRTQRVVKTIPTDDPEKDNMIAERVRQGYIWNGVTVKPETVKIYKYTK